MSKTKQKQLENEGAPKENTKHINQIPKSNLPPGIGRYRIQFDIHYKGHPGTEMDSESLTEPNMTMSIGQLLERHSKGQDVPTKQPLYFNMEIPTIQDLTDVEARRDQLKAEYERVEQFIAQEEAELKEKEQAEKAEKDAAQAEQPAKDADK